MAASTRSWSISTSPDLTASGSIRRLSSCLRPSIFAVTVPPPDEASTTVSCIFFCTESYCAFAFDIRSWRLNPPIKPQVSKFQGLQGPRVKFRQVSKPIETSHLPFFPVVDHGSYLGAEFFLHAADD